ncbi:MAG: LytTR family transcriptional regulator [Flavobacteriaceae bacterium]|nr:LytTR family transcriptional regulator [Flavobacteriaceae bacterium]
MRKDRLYLFTFVAITLLFVIISTFAIRYFVDAAANKVIDTQLDVSKREVKQMALLIGNQLSHRIPKDSILVGVQASIENSDLESGFVTIFDWSGKVVSHPNVTQLGKQMSHQESIINSISDEVSSEDLYQLLEKSEDDAQSESLQGKDKSEIVNLYPVPNSDWIVAGHTNTSLLAAQIDDLRKKFLNILLVMGFFFILSTVIMVRIIGSRYEKMLEMKNEKLSDEVINLTKLNSAVSEYQQRVIEQRDDTPEGDTNTKKRILTYIRHELLPIAIQEISYIYTENTITYVICHDGKKSTANSSLDELYSQLDPTIFFRANRQFIISISSIDKIMRYGNNQLKIVIEPASETDIIISKNRAAEFKQWLNL